MKFLIRFFVVCCFLISFNDVMAIKDPVKFGKVSMEELEMKSYKPDSSAAAVVLFSYGYFDAENYMFIQTIRVKIFKKEGYDFANQKFAVGNKTVVKGKTFNLVNGEIVVDKLKNESIFRERVTKNFYRVNVAMPNVKEGSVIDLKIVSNRFPYHWYFQEEIPVVWSELRIGHMDFLNYRKNYFGYEALSVSERYRWVAKDVPAFQKEPFINSKENYITKFEFDIISVDYPGYYYQDVASTWDAISESLLDSKYFGVLMRSGSYINKAAKEIETKNLSDEEKIKTAVEFIQNSMDFNGKNRYYGSETDLDFIKKGGNGNSADINLALIQLLDKLGFEVLPVVLSTKSNGLLSKIYSSFRRLNFVLAYVKINDEFILVDATDELLPYNLVPKECLNSYGRIIKEINSDWIDLTTEMKNEKVVYYDLKLNENLSLTGTLNYLKNDYAAYDFRRKFHDHNNSNEEYAKYLTDKNPDLEILDVEIKNVDDIYKPITEKYEVKINNQAIAMDNTIYLIPTLFDQMKENPFKANERKYPVDFDNKVDISGTIIIEVPENAEVIELPKSQKFVMPDDGGSFLYSIGHMNNKITLSFKLKINKTRYFINEYDYLKGFYSEIIKKESEPLVIEMK